MSEINSSLDENLLNSKDENLLNSKEETYFSDGITGHPKQLYLLFLPKCGSDLVFMECALC